MLHFISWVADGLCNMTATSKSVKALESMHVQLSTKDTDIHCVALLSCDVTSKVLRSETLTSFGIVR